MDIDQIRAIIAMMKENDLSEFSMEQNGLKIRIRRGPEGFQQVVSTAAPVAAPALAVAAAKKDGAPEIEAAPGAKGPAETLQYVTSPMVGTFYLSPAPETPSYVGVGSEIEPDTVVCIIEAMKVMNEIKAEVTGVITEILVENAKPVEFGQKLFVVRPR